MNNMALILTGVLAGGLIATFSSVFTINRMLDRLEDWEDEGQEL